jgi:thiamine biosynthesis lipoprotein
MSPDGALVLGFSTFKAIGTTVSVLTVDPEALPAAKALLELQLRELDESCSRFQPSSELSRAQQAGGSPVVVSALLADLVRTSLEVAQMTDGAVDPTVGDAIVALGYDRDYAAVAVEGPGPGRRPRPVPGWQCIVLDHANRLLTVPEGAYLDLGSTAKAFAADRAAEDIASELGTGALVNLGGDIATAGPRPEDGWRVALALSSSAGPDETQVTVTLRSAALASSGTTVRVWNRGDRRLHHIVDPRTGDVADDYWALATVAAERCVLANAASTAAIVTAEKAPEVLLRLGLPARLVRRDGRVFTLNGWPEG